MRHPATLNLVALLCLSIAMTVSVRASWATADHRRISAATPERTQFSRLQRLRDLSIDVVYIVDPRGQRDRTTRRPTIG